MKEIGSEFWSVERVCSDTKYFVSGRTALDFIIQDIIKTKKLERVHVPSFCCYSMIEPFFRHGLHVIFYDVYCENGILKAELPLLSQEEVFFYINYFGYKNQCIGDLDKVEKNGCVIIEDATHSWLSDEEKMHSSVDYQFVSYRKWSGFSGISVARKATGKFNIEYKKQEYECYDDLRRKAQYKKKRFIEFTEGEKIEFLQKFEEAEGLLEKDYINYTPSNESIKAFMCLDRFLIKEKRRINAQVVLDGIKQLKEITPVFKKLEIEDVPLCVPILLDASIRDDFRKYLISEKIYCPIHWPLSELHVNISDRAKSLYRRELSLVCDQRYGEADMMRLLGCVRKYFD